MCRAVLAGPVSGLLSHWSGLGLMIPSDCKGSYGMNVAFLCPQEVEILVRQTLSCLQSAFSRPVERGVYAKIRYPLACLSQGMHLWSCHPGLVIGEQVYNRPFSLTRLFTWSSQTSLVLFCVALNLIGPRAVDVLSELSYAPMTPDHFPSLFCKVGASEVLVSKGVGSVFYRWQSHVLTVSVTPPKCVDVY